MLITGAHPSLDIINHTKDVITYIFHKISHYLILDSDG